MQLRLISNLEVGSLQPSLVVGENNENGAKPSNVQQVSREDYESVSADSSYSEGDKSSMDGDIARLVDDMEVKVNNANDSVQNVRNETKIITKKYDDAMERMRIMEAVLELQFKTILSVKSMRDLRRMKTYLSEQEINYSECPSAFECVSREISDLITLSLETTRNNTSDTNLVE